MMQDTYPDSYKVYAKIVGVWTDITRYIIKNITGRWGLPGRGPHDRMAEPGWLKFTMKNDSGQWLPGMSTTLAGWEKGIEIKVVFVYETETFVRWKGIIETIDPGSGVNGHLRVDVKCVTWLEYAANHPIVNPGVLTNQRGDDVIRTTLGLMPIQPAATRLDVGSNIFPTTFDVVTSNTRAYTEFSRVAFSEIGYVYEIHDRFNGETLVFENATHRQGIQPLSQISIRRTLSDVLITESGEDLLTEDGEQLIIDAAQDFVADNTMMDVLDEYGKSVINQFTVTANPRRVDTAPVTLFKLDAPMMIGSWQTLEIKGNYVDPNGGDQINAQDTPVPTIDYEMRSNEDGSGTDLTANLHILSTQYGSEGFTHTVRNESSSIAYISKFDILGYGIYVYNTIDQTESNTPSINKYGVLPGYYDQEYKTDLQRGTLYALRVVDEEGTPRKVVNGFTFLANKSPDLMYAFLQGDIGFLFRAIATTKEVDAQFYVHAVEFTIKPGAVIYFTWMVKEVASLTSGLAHLGIEFVYYGVTDVDYVDFGQISELYNLKQKSISFWMKLGALEWALSGLIGWVTDTQGFQILYDATHNGIKVINSFTVQDLISYMTNPVISSVDTTNWYHVVVTLDTSVDPLAYPIIYVNGSSAQPLTNTAPLGSKLDENGTRLLMGNLYPVYYGKYYYDQFVGQLKDIRIFNSILSQSQSAKLNSDGAGGAGVTDGMIFQAFFVRSDDHAAYVGKTLNSDDKLMDNVNGYIGIPNGGSVSGYSGDPNNGPIGS